MIRSFAQSGWLADIRGVQRDTEAGGLAMGMPSHSFGTDRQGVASKFSTEVVVSEWREKELSDLGFLPLCDCKDTEFSAFYACQSIQKPKTYSTAGVTTNARLSSMLQYMLCVSRFAHYIKVIGRDKVGTFQDKNKLEAEMHNWIMDYVTADSGANANVLARHPLKQAGVELRDIPGKPGCYRCVMHLAPHYELDEMSAGVKVGTEVAPPGKN